ncbi:polymerase/histidinol phosphatase-like protein [Elsinoe ampelina]|uniref:Histidinol-phosphatase n=1 Tax=Elsinoe ampelina TaxID=302913 RepID=A0A6A6GEB4_9PEZI|nr:polymerase/histidinol phosphatase-like protein [Elsinoe ampelina]
MLWSTHTHSGQFCTHATSTLREVILRALSLGLTTICLTEHIPRHPADFYPGEETHPLVLTHGDLFAVFAAYHTEACALRDEFADRIQVLVGFEGEWISSSRRTEGVMEELRSKYEFDLWLGSVHHVAGVPIDFTQGEYDRARDMCGGNDEGLAERYFDEQLEMLRGEPPVVAHFDLVRLLAGRKDGDWRGWKGVWERIVRNLKVAKGYGGVLEVNSAALRKGLEDVYPRREVLEEWRGMGGRLTISDDSHGVGQLCTNYGRALEGITGLSHRLRSS